MLGPTRERVRQIREIALSPLHRLAKGKALRYYLGERPQQPYTKPSKFCNNEIFFLTNDISFSKLSHTLV